MARPGLDPGRAMYDQAHRAEPGDHPMININLVRTSGGHVQEIAIRYEQPGIVTASFSHDGDPVECQEYQPFDQADARAVADRWAAMYEQQHGYVRTLITDHDWALDEGSTFSQTVARLGARGHHVTTFGYPTADVEAAMRDVKIRLHAAADRVKPPVPHELAKMLLDEEIQAGPVA